MENLSIHDLAQACRIFMELAYPEGAHSIPESKRPYADIATELGLEAFLSPAPIALGVCQDVPQGNKGTQSYTFRLGSAAHPHLKLRVQPLEVQDGNVWVFSVDTHDRFLMATQHLNADEAQKWHDLVEQNRLLKHQIEDSLSLAGLMTPKSVLQLDLTS